MDCEYCNKTFANKFNKERHVKKSHHIADTDSDESDSGEKTHDIFGKIPRNIKTASHYASTIDDDQEDDNASNVSSGEEESSMKRKKLKTDDSIKDDESRAWNVVLYTARLDTDGCKSVDDLWEDSSIFKRTLARLQAVVSKLDWSMKTLKNGVIYGQILEEVERLRAHGYSKDEAMEVAWRHRKYLVRKMLNGQKEFLNETYFEGDDGDQDEEGKECEICGKICKSAAGLASHSKIHK